MKGGGHSVQSVLWTGSRDEMESGLGGSMFRPVYFQTIIQNHSPTITLTHIRIYIHEVLAEVNGIRSGIIYTCLTSLTTLHNAALQEERGNSTNTRNEPTNLDLSRSTSEFCRRRAVRTGACGSDSADL